MPETSAVVPTESAATSRRTLREPFRMWSATSLMLQSSSEGAHAACSSLTPVQAVKQLHPRLDRAWPDLGMGVPLTLTVEVALDAFELGLLVCGHMPP